MWFSKDKKPEEKEKKPKIEDQLLNPLKVHLGGFIEIKDLESKTLEVLRIDEIERTISSQKFSFADYYLEDESILRVIPKSDGEFDVLHLKHFWDGEFEESIQEAVKCKEFYKNNEDGSKLTYTSLKAGEKGFNCETSSVKKGDTDLQVYHSTYWDFFRKPDPSLGEISTEDIILFVEIDNNDGYITMLEGSLIPSKSLTVFNIES
jgi:hypothetical protein